MSQICLNVGIVEFSDKVVCPALRCVLRHMDIVYVVPFFPLVILHGQCLLDGLQSSTSIALIEN